MINDILYLIQCDNVVGGYCQQSYIIRPGIVGHNTINSNAIVQLIISNCFKMGGICEIVIYEIRIFPLLALPVF